MTFKPIEAKEYYINKIAKDIINFEWKWYYKPILDILKPGSVTNESNALFNGLKSGALYYQNGAFYSKTGRFSNTISKELENIGARYSRYGRCYRLAKEKLPDKLAWAIETVNAKTFSKVVAIKEVMDNVIGSVDEIIKHLKVTDVAEQMILDVQERAYKNFQANKIETITPKMSDSIARKFAENYTDTLRFEIKGKLPEEVIKMREVVGQMAIDGESPLTIQKYIEKNFIKDQKRAKFLARNESAIAVTEYLSAKYQDEGSEEFIWIANLDERVRDEHRELNGKKFRYDDPPIVDKRTGSRGMPSEFYNCRCKFIPVFSKFRYSV